MTTTMNTTLAALAAMTLFMVTALLGAGHF